MLIVLEGCDGTGKSTLAKTLATILDAEIIHCSQYTPNDYSFFHSIIEASRTKNIIADRFCYGQFVYQTEDERPLHIPTSGIHIVTIGKDSYPVENGFSSLGSLHVLETEMLAAGAKIIHVTAPVDEIEERLQARKERLINGLSIEEVVNRFKGTFKMSMLPIIEYNTGRYKYE